jgi:hypothetical protein
MQCGFAYALQPRKAFFTRNQIQKFSPIVDDNSGASADTKTMAGLLLKSLKEADTKIRAADDEVSASQ